MMRMLLRWVLCLPVLCWAALLTLPALAQGTGGANGAGGAKGSGGAAAEGGAKGGGGAAGTGGANGDGGATGAGGAKGEGGADGAGGAKATVSAPKPDDDDDDGEDFDLSCDEYVPKGATPPTMTETFPPEGLSGYRLGLRLVITHGAGETVMPEGFRLKEDDAFFPALREADFAMADIHGDAAPIIERPESPSGSTATTTVRLFFVALPDDPGRRNMTLPRVPISVARANGQVMTVCTQPHTIVIEDPIANEVDPKVKPNPPPRPQREEWTAAKNVTQVLLLSIAVGLLLAYLIQAWRSRPKEIPEPPKELPWVVAMRELSFLRRSGMLDNPDKLDELFDRVDHCTRRYLGERYGFDGLESTTEEIRGFLSRVRPPVVDSDRVDKFLSDTDLVKYTDMVPTRDDCADVLDRAELIVTKTTPAYATAAEGADKDNPPSSRRAA